MNLEIEINERNNGKFFHKNKGIDGATKCKQIALKDITKDCGEGKFFTRNYINSECAVLDTCKNVLIIIPIDTTKY